MKTISYRKRQADYFVKGPWRPNRNQSAQNARKMAEIAHFRFFSQARRLTPRTTQTDISTEIDIRNDYDHRQKQTAG
jgi:hypothetical protein